MTEPSELAKRIWREALDAASGASIKFKPSADTAAARVIDSYLPGPDDVEKVARALGKSHGLDFDEVCGVDENPDEGYCDSGTCIASGFEDHDAAYARACYLSDARAAIAALRGEA